MRTKVFKNGNSKAVRIPASIKILGSEVEIEDLGEEGILLKPISQPRSPWELFREGVEELRGDWPERVREADQNRADW
jgi:virulence-associated protein VagC